MSSNVAITLSQISPHMNICYNLHPHFACLFFTLVKTLPQQAIINHNNETFLTLECQESHSWHFTRADRTQARFHQNGSVPRARAESLIITGDWDVKVQGVYVIRNHHIVFHVSFFCEEVSQYRHANLHSDGHFNKLLIGQNGRDIFYKQHSKEDI